MMNTHTTPTATNITKGHQDSDDNSRENEMTPSESRLIDEESTASTNDSALHSTSTSATGVNRNKTIMDEERKQLASRESKALAYLRMMVFLVLLASAISVSVIVYSYLNAQQVKNFEEEFEAHSTKLIEAVHQVLERQLEAIDNLSVAITNHALSSGENFPNVTIPNFEISGSGTRILSGSNLINFYPLVTEATRAGWEAYFVENRDKYFDVAVVADETQRSRQDNRFGLTNTALKDGNGRAIQENSYFNTIYNQQVDGSYVVAPPHSGPYLPLWQMSPVTLKFLVGYNGLSHLSVSGALNEVLLTKTAVMDVASNVGERHTAEIDEYFELLLSRGQYRGTIDDLINEPATGLGYPVFNSFDVATREVTGTLLSTFVWRIYLQDVLPQIDGSIICVLENNRGQRLTYTVDGPEAKFIGRGDLHETKYDYLEVVADMAAYIANEASIQTRSYTSVEFNGTFTSYSLHVYPSSSFESRFVNNAPVVFAIIILMVFLFTSCIFVVYDRLVARRQRIVMNRALASGHIVSSLFPTKILDQLYQENEIQKKKSTQNAWKSLAGIVANNENSSIVNRTSGDGCFEEESSKRRTKGNFNNSHREYRQQNGLRHIADSFEHTTVLFADIAGFTAWSSNRTPGEVFELLGSIYHAFDKLATRLKVFKVETIGDCYMAVTGLPDPQPDHAVIMAKFAHACLQKMNEIVISSDVMESLGGETADLEIRIGLNSGSVTAGVLRSQKSRFQLFGDTVNTASRMESTGMKGRIQCSQSTADALVAAGKQRWITPREEIVTAKGKGEIQTYWINMKDSKSSLAPSD